MNAQEQLEKLINLTNDKFEMTVHLLSKTSDIITKFQNPIKLDHNKNYKCALKYFSVFNNIQNITENNNELRYKLAPGKWQLLKIPPGAYDVKDLSAYIISKIGNHFSFIADKPTSKVILKISKEAKDVEDIGIDFRYSKSFRELLGFSNDLFIHNKDPKTKDIEFIAEHHPKIDLDKSMINITADFINNGFIQNNNDNLIHNSNILFSIPTFTVPVGYKIIESPTNPEYLPITCNTLNQIRLQVVDEENNLYDFRGDDIVIKLHIKQV